MDLHDGDTFWMRSAGLPAVYPALGGTRHCDVVVVGGGITGALVAMEFAERGAKVLVIDRRDVATGSTAASTALLQYEIDELLVDLTAMIGEDGARTAYRECSRAIDLVEQVAARVGDGCGFRRSPSLFVAPTSEAADTLRKECAARREAGFEVAWLEQDTLRARWGIAGMGAIQSEQAAGVDPYRLAHACLRRVVDLGGEVVDRTEVVSYAGDDHEVHLTTDRGYDIVADWCVIATGYEVESLLPELKMDLNTTFALISEPIDGIWDRYPQGLIFWELATPYLYGRISDDGRLLVGGGDVATASPWLRRRTQAAKVRALQRSMAKRAPELRFEIAYTWSGTFAETPDGLAYIGGHPSRPRFQFALGFGGNGITYSALAAQYLAAAIDGRPHEHAWLFRLDR